MNHETKVGLFLLFGLAVILPSVLFIGNIKLFQKTKRYFVDFENVEALPPKAAVKVAGVEIGKVTDIDLVNGQARVRIDVDPDIDIDDDAAAQIGSTGIIGTRFVELLPGSMERPVIKEGATIEGLDGSGLNQMVSKISELFEKDKEYGDAVSNLKAILSNLKNVSESLNKAVGEKRKEMQEIVMNIRDLTENAKVLTGDLRDVVSQRKDDVNITLQNFRSVSEKLDNILAKIESGEGTIGTLVNDEETAQNVKETIASLKGASERADHVLGRFTVIKTFWNYRMRYDFTDEDVRSDIGIKFMPRPGKFYSLGVTNVGELESNEKNLLYERHNRITITIGADWKMFTGYAGAIRSDGGVGFLFRPLWINKELENRLVLDFEAADFNRDRIVQGNRLDSAWTAAGARFSIAPWIWLGARVEDILERPSWQGTMDIVFGDKDLAYFFGFASLSR